MPDGWGYPPPPTSTDDGSERVVPWDLDVVWEPNVPDAVLLSTENGSTALALNPRWDDESDGCVVLTWGSIWASIGQPNDEARPGHRLYEAGLSDLSAWGGVVQNSALIAELARQEDVMFRPRGDEYARYTHYVVPLKECFVEVVGVGLRVHRHVGTTLEAAVAVLARDRDG